MTQQDESLFAAFEARLSLLMSRYDQLKAENAELRTKLDTLRTNYAEGQKELEKLRADYLNLQTVHVLAAGDGSEIETTRKQIRDLIRDVDKCIDLINA